jgi:predicted O-linked N-acetylglucosamine transferase (SPINDLY family)
VTFGSFNNITKLVPGVFKLWARVVNAVPGSRLLLKSGSLTEASVQANVLKTFAENGLAADRIELRGSSPYPEMLREYDDIDIALDPFPFGGATTSCDALWMGVPVVTLPGDRLASRQTYSFLHYMGYAEFAASSPDHYVARCVALAADPGRLKNLRHDLRAALIAAPFSDGPKFTAGLEEAYRIMWRRHVAGESPAAFDVLPNGSEFRRNGAS